MKLRQVATAITIALLSLSPLMAQHGNGAGCGTGNGGGNGWNGGNGNGKHQQQKGEDLGLSQDQLNQLAILRAKHKSDVLPVQQQVTATRGKINDLLKTDSPDRAAISKETAKIADLHKQLQEMRVNHLLEVKKVMTKEQWLKFLDRDKRGQHSMGNGSGECRNLG